MRRLLPFVFLLATSALAQTPHATLTGTARSARHGVGGVAVTVSSPALQGSRTTTTVANGDYSFDALPPGKYDIQFAKKGYATVTHRGVLTLAQASRVDAELQPSEEEESITATGTATTVLETPEIATTFDHELIERLPIRRGIDLRTALAPGDFIFLHSAPTTFDGVQLPPARPFITLVEDSIDQTTVLGGALSPGWSDSAGGTVLTITKSGGNDFSGSLRDTITSDIWHGRSSFSPLVPRGRRLNHNFEGTFGGRIIPDRLWFFVAASHLRTRTLYSESGDPIGYLDHASLIREQAKITAAPTSSGTLVASALHDSYRDAGTFMGTDFKLHQTWEFGSIGVSSMIGSRGFVEALAGETHVALDNTQDFRSSVSPNNGTLRAGWFLGGERAGSHELTAGYERSHDTGRDLGRSSAWFVNDRWHLGAHWSFNLGARFDRDSDVFADVTFAEPRLAAIFDVHGDGHSRWSLSHGHYVDRLAFGQPVRVDETALAYAMQIGGNGFVRVDGWRRRWVHPELASNTRKDVIELQGSYRFLGLLEAGGNYTWITQDQQLPPAYHHRANVWVQFNAPVPHGTLSAAVLEQVLGYFKSYLSVTGVDVTYSIPVSRATLFAKGDVMDIANRTIFEPREFRLGLGARF